MGKLFFFFFYQGKKTTTNKQTNKKKTLFAFENCQNSFSGVPPSVHSGLPNTWILEVKALRLGFCPRSIQEKYILRESKKPGFTFSTELRINPKFSGLSHGIFSMITWMKKVDNYQIAKFSLRVLLNFCLSFGQISLVLFTKVLLIKKRV